MCMFSGGGASFGNGTKNEDMDLEKPNNYSPTFSFNN